MTEPKDYTEFWPFYLGEHKLKINRQLHFLGTSLGLFVLAYAVLTFHLALVPLAFVVGYAFAWFGHFVFEKNKPATFKYPLWSLKSDWRMWKLILKGQLDDELKKYHLTP